MAEPLVSVLIPAFNAGERVEEAVESVLAQTYRVFEIVLVDDGSTDDTRRRLRRFEHLENFTYLYQPNKNYWCARNRALQCASGELVALLDADDLWFPHKLARQVEAMIAGPELGLVCTDYEIQEVNGTIRASKARLDEVVERGDSFRELLRRMFILPSTAMLRRSVLAELGGFDETLAYASDRSLFIRIARNHPIGIIREVLVRYRRHDRNVTNRLEDILCFDPIAYERFRRGAIPLNQQEFRDVEEFLVGRYRRLARYQLRKGDGRMARRMLVGLFRLRPFDPLLCTYPLSYSRRLAGTIYRWKHRLGYLSNILLDKVQRTN